MPAKASSRALSPASLAPTGEGVFKIAFAGKPGSYGEGVFKSAFAGKPGSYGGGVFKIAFAGKPGSYRGGRGIRQGPFR